MNSIIPQFRPEIADTVCKQHVHAGGAHPEEAVLRGLKEINSRLLSSNFHDPTCYDTFGNGRSSPSFISLYGGGYRTTMSLNGPFCTAKVMIVQEGKVSLSCRIHHSIQQTA